MIAVALLWSGSARAADSPVPTAAPSVPYLPPLLEPAQNPYLEALYAWAAAELAKPDVPWRACTPQFNVFTGLNRDYGTRDEAEKMMRFIFLVGHPQSKYRGQSELFARLLRRAHAYIDAWDLHGKAYGDNVNDFFALGPALYSFRAIDQLWPTALPPDERARWDRVIRRMADFWLKVYDDGRDKGPYRLGKYCNRDLGVANILLNAGLWLHDQRCLDIARRLVAAQADNLYPDGGWAYIGTQNESCGYHGADTTLLARYWLSSGDATAKDLLVRSQWYGPLSVEAGGVADYWTPPSWKQMWNGGGSNGSEVVASLSGNRYLRTQLDAGLAHPGVDLLATLLYRRDVPGAPLPDHYTVLDRNLQGPRARYGRFSYAATTRVPNPDEPGKATLMGAMIVDPPGSRAYPLHAALMEAMPKVRLTLPGGKLPVWAWLTHHDSNAVTVGRHFAALSSEYGMHTFASSTKGAEVPWTGFQAWLGLRDRLVGLLELAPRGAPIGEEVAAVFRLGVGGTAAGPVKDLRATSERDFEFGDLRLTVHAHNFAQVAPVETKVRVTKAWELTFRDRPSDQPRWCVVELRPAWATGALTAARVVTPDGVTALRVAGPGLRCTLLRNRGRADVTVGLADTLLPGVRATLHAGGAVRTPPPAQVVLPAGAQALVVCSDDDAWRAPGWESFAQMVGGTR